MNISLTLETEKRYDFPNPTCRSNGINEPKVIFIPTPLDNPITGGEIYEARLLEFLRKKFRIVESIKIDTLQLATNIKKSSFEMVFIILRSIIRNLLYVRAVNKTDNKTTVVLEDTYYSTDLFLFNFLIRRIRKNVSIVPMVHHLYHSLGKQKLYQILLKATEAFLLNESDWIIVNSKATAKDVKNLLKKTKKILVAYPGLDKTKMTSRKISHTSENRRLRILTVGSVTERKNFETLLKALKLLVCRSSKVDFSVNIVGDLEKDKEFSARIVEVADSLSLSNYVIFNGRVDNNKLCNIYASSDVFVSTSLHEGFGMAIAEAMCNHLPVVAVKSGAVSYLVEDGVNGFLVPPKDYEQLAEKIKLLLESEELRNKMGAQGFYKAKEFNWNRTFAKICKKLLET